MAGSRGQTPPINLKERIAALQQRSVSPNTHQSAQAVPRSVPSPGSGGLRDKIAKFEEKGGRTPVPRADGAPLKKRAAVGLPPRVPTGEGDGPRKRCISTGAGLSGAPTGVSTTMTDEPVPAVPHGPRRNSLAVPALRGRRVVSEGGEVDGLSLPSSPSSVPEKPPDSAVEGPSEAGLGVVDPPATSPPPVEDTPDLERPGPGSGPERESCSLPDAFQGSVDGLSEEESTPVSRPSPSVSISASSAPDVDISLTPDFSDTESKPTPEDTVVATAALSTPDINVSGTPDSPDTPTTRSDTTTPAPEETAVAISTKEATVTLSAPDIDVSRAPECSDTSTTESAPEETVVTTSTQEATVVPIPVPVLPSMPIPQTRTQSKPTFKAVVHRRVTEPLIASPPNNLAPPEEPQMTKPRRSASHRVVADVPPSPGVGDLALLLEDAARLELRLTEGDGLKAKEFVSTTPTPTSTTFQADVRHGWPPTLAEPLSDSGSQSARSMSIPSIREPLMDGDIPEEDETDGRSLASTTFSQRSPSHRNYLASIYRLGRRSSGYIPGTYPRDSMSMSSEDSSPVTTPSDNGKRKGFGIAWPSGSPKKGVTNVSRSSSFADKIFHRNRTKSNASTAADPDRLSLYGSSQPSLTLSFPSELSPEGHGEGVEVTRPTSWIAPGDASEFSPASSLLDKDIFDAFPSVPQTLPPGYRLEDKERASTLPVKGRKQGHARTSMV